jgi:hypothetical protein
MAKNRVVSLVAGGVAVEGNLTIPEATKGLVLFAHGSGSSRHSPRNRYVECSPKFCSAELRRGYSAGLRIPMLNAARCWNRRINTVPASPEPSAVHAPCLRYAHGGARSSA